MEPVQETQAMLQERIAKVLKEGSAAAEALANEVHVSDLVEALDQLPPSEAARLIQLLPLDTAVEVFDEHSFSTRGQVLAELELDLATALSEAMSPDERADLFHQISSDLAEVLRPRLSREVAQNLSTLLRYPEESAGGIMTTEFVTLRPHFTVKEAIDHIRTVAEGVETIYYAYLVNASSGVLAGVISLRELLLSLPETPVQELTLHEPKSVRVDTDQEDVARLLARYNLLAVPVLNAKGQIVGIVTVDDVLDVLVEEQSEDIHKLGAVEPTEAPYFLTGFFQMIRKRVVWLVILFVGGFFTETALRHYDWVLKEAIHLIYFLPLIIASGGNSGSQSATLVVRAIATGDVQISQWARVFSREFLQGLTLGLILGTIGFFRAYLWGRPLDISFAVAATLVAVVTAGTTIGSMLPILSKRLGFDPAVSSTPFIASLVDVTGIVIYIKVASLLLGL